MFYGNEISNKLLLNKEPFLSNKINYIPGLTSVYICVLITLRYYNHSTIVAFSRSPLFYFTLSLVPIIFILFTFIP